MKDNKPLNIEYVQRKIDEGFHYTQHAKDRDLVLVIGNTGVGKSTTCNYLLGHQMKEAKDKNNRPVIETVDPPTLAIGHKVTAETLYAKPVGSDSFDWLLTDCPGFFGNRSIEDGIIESISTELAIRSARQIKGILVLISINHLQETKVSELRSLVKTLIALFKNPTEMVQYTTFVITKKYKYMPDHEAKDITIGAIEALKAHCEDQVHKLTNNEVLSSAEGLASIEYDQIAAYFDALLKNKDQIIFANPLDGGKSRQLIIDKINGVKPRKGLMRTIASGAKNALISAVGYSSATDEVIQPITIHDFNFSNYDANRIRFNLAINDRADEGYQLVANMRSCEKIIRTALATLRDGEERLVQARTLKRTLSEGDTSSTTGIDPRSIETWNNIIVKNNKLINQKGEGYELCLKYRIKPTNEEVEENKIYLFVENNIIKYMAKDQQGNVETASIQEDELFYESHERLLFHFLRARAKQINIYDEIKTKLLDTRSSQRLSEQEEKAIYQVTAKSGYQLGRIAEINQQVVKLQKELGRIDNDKPSVFRKDELYRDINYFNFFGWAQLKFEANTNDATVPIIKVDKKFQNGIWHEEDDRRDSGVYKITYKSHYRARPAQASVIAYIKTKDEPGNRKRIKQIKQELEQLSAELVQLNTEVSEHISENQVLQANIDSAKTGKLGVTAERQRRIKDTEHDIERYTALIMTNKQLVEQNKTRGTTLLQEFNQIRHKFDNLVVIVNLLELKSHLVKQFISTYSEFSGQLDNYNALFEGNEVDDSYTSDEDTIADEFKDPITGRKIRVPVVTSAGTLFDEKSLFELFRSDNKQPYKYQHADGREEIIAYQTWTRVPDIQNFLEQRKNQMLLKLAETSSFSPSSFKGMTREQLESEREKLTKELDELKAETERKETRLNKIKRLLENHWLDNPTDTPKLDLQASRAASLNQQPTPATPNRTGQGIFEPKQSLQPQTVPSELSEPDSSSELLAAEAPSPGG